jgi:shikimate kinase
MSEQKNIILTGFMGTGKSTVGRVLAQLLGYVFVDTDNLVAQRAGKPVSLIFAEDGERTFREWEASITEELVPHRGLVIATGGGLFTSERNAEMLEGTGPVFCLAAKPKEILKRIKASGEHRPLLDAENPQQRLEELLAERAPIYEKYEQIDTSGKSPDRVAKAILNELKKYEV